MDISNYDIIVLGTNLGALISASFFCKNGYRTILIEEHEEKQSSHELFDEDSTTFVSGCAPNRLLYNIFRELGIPIHHQKKFKVNDLSYQIALPDCRIDVGSSWNLYHQEALREFDNDIKAIEAVYDEVFKCDKLLNEVFYNYLLHPQNLSSKLKSSFVMHLESIFKINEEGRGISNIITTDFVNSRFREVIDIQERSLSSLAQENSNMIALFLLGAFQRGIAQDPNSLDILKRILKEQISLNHGEFLKVKRIERINATSRNPLKDTKGISVRFEGSQRPVEGKFLVYGQSLHNLPKALKGMKLPQSVKKLAAKFAPTHAKLTFSYKIDRWGIPIGLRSRVLLMPDINGNSIAKKSKTILISLSHLNEEESENQTFLLKGTILEPFKSGAIKAERLKELHNEVTEYLKEIVPFFDDFVKPLHLRSYSDIKLAEISNGDFLYNASFLRNLSLGEVDSCEIIKNIFFTGKEFLPQLGFEGELISGWRTANIITNKFKIHKMY